MAKRTREVGRVQVGKVFGNLTVVEVYQKLTPKPRLFAVCRCDCGLPNCRGTVHLRHDAIGKKMLSCGAVDTPTSRVKAGSRFGFLEVLRLERTAPPNYELIAYCRCLCGTKKCKQYTRTAVYHLIAGKSKSCGCCSRSGDSRGVFPETYRSWEHMLDRCYNEKHPHYKHYGGRGIVVCDRWRESFDAFLEDMGERPDELTLDRNDTDGNYEPGNCQWATYQEQNRNKTNGTELTFQGETKSVTEWAEKTGISRTVIYGRLRHGWPIDLTLTTTRGPKGRYVRLAHAQATHLPRG